MMRTMILLGALLLGTASSAQAADARQAVRQAVRQADLQVAAQAMPARPAVHRASFQTPRVSLRARIQHEPSTYSLLLVAIGLLGLRMRARAPSEKFSH